MIFHEFHNAVRILYSIDMHELVDAGVITDTDEWRSFQRNPPIWFIKAPDHAAEKVWALVAGRMGREMTPTDDIPAFLPCKPVPTDWRL